MTRQIKFRIWNRDTKEMVYPNEENTAFDDEICIGLNGRVYNVGDSYGDGGWCYEEENVDISQFTGLKDKNGKEIYEGDVVKLGTYTKVVKWNNNGSFNVRKPIHPNNEIKTEVIGNVWENPELIHN